MNKLQLTQRQTCSLQHIKKAPLSFLGSLFGFFGLLSPLCAAEWTIRPLSSQGLLLGVHLEHPPEQGSDLPPSAGPMRWNQVHVEETRSPWSSDRILEWVHPDEQIIARSCLRKIDPKSEELKFFQMESFETGEPIEESLQWTWNAKNLILNQENHPVAKVNVLTSPKEQIVGYEIHTLDPESAAPCLAEAHTSPSLLNPTWNLTGEPQYFPLITAHLMYHLFKAAPQYPLEMNSALSIGGAFAIGATSLLWGASQKKTQPAQAPDDFVEHHHSLSPDEKGAGRLAGYSPPPVIKKPSCNVDLEDSTLITFRPNLFVQTFGTNITCSLDYSHQKINSLTLANVLSQLRSNISVQYFQHPRQRISVNMSSNQLTDADIPQLFEFLQTAPIIMLNLDHNRFTQDGIIRFQTHSQSLPQARSGNTAHVFFSRNLTLGAPHIESPWLHRLQDSCQANGTYKLLENLQDDSDDEACFDASPHDSGYESHLPCGGSVD